MRLFLRHQTTFLVLNLLFTLVLSTSIVRAEDGSLFFRTLQLGDSGVDVYNLQVFLNTSPDTRVSASGIGSPGYETQYFGPLTKQAVIKFQEKYRKDILTPIGLVFGTGVVGPRTHQKMNSFGRTEFLGFSTSSSFVPTATASSSVGVTIIPTPPPPVSQQVLPAASSPATFSTNPNATYLEEFIAAVHTEGLKQGTPKDILYLIEQRLRENAATTTDLTKEFIKTQIKSFISQPITSAPRSFIEKIKNNLLALSKSFIPTAQAVGGLSIGGRLKYADPYYTCSCSGGTVSYLYIGDNNPSIATNKLVSYVNGSQIFSAYTLPYVSQVGVVGEYIPGLQSCYMYVYPSDCVPVPNAGTLTSFTGTSIAPQSI